MERERVKLIKYYLEQSACMYGNMQKQALTLINELESENKRLCKETAEKFYDKVMSFIGSNQKFWIVDEEHITIIQVDKLCDFVMETAKSLQF